MKSESKSWRGTSPKGSWLNTTKIPERNESLQFPCKKLDYCPYGQLVEEFPCRIERDNHSCPVFGHDCPVFYQAEFNSGIPKSQPKKKPKSSVAKTVKKEVKKVAKRARADIDTLSDMTKIPKLPKGSI